MMKHWITKVSVFPAHYSLSHKKAKLENNNHAQKRCKSTGEIG